MIFIAINSNFSLSDSILSFYMAMKNGYEVVVINEKAKKHDKFLWNQFLFVTLHPKEMFYLNINY